MHDYSCPHDDDERGWVSTTTSIELNEALNEGYTVSRVYRVLEYENVDKNLFAPYIAEFMAVKLHASGFSKEISGNAELEQQFVRECKEKFGIVIEPSKMIVNPGLRALAKLLLNNLCMK